MSRTNYANRDASIRINSYTTVVRREGVPHEVFAAYWRDAHGPLCARIPGLGWYVQNHFSRDDAAHLWPCVDGIEPLSNYRLDGAVEIGFGSEEKQQRFKAASHLLFSDEQNVFAETLAYDLPQGSQTLVDVFSDPIPNATQTVDRMHVHFHPAHDDERAFRNFMNNEFAAVLASDPAVLKLRLHLPRPYDNEKPNPPAPNVAHHAPPDRVALAMMEIVFASPLARRQFFLAPQFQSTLAGQKQHFRHASPFAVTGVFTYVRNDELTLAGLRGSRTAQLVERLGAVNQDSSSIRALMRDGSLGA
jgi:hypothetical protein